MEEDLSKINKVVSEHVGDFRQSERVEKTFNFGVELGRLLERNSVASYRLPFFIESEKLHKVIKDKEALIQKAEKLLLRLVVMAYKAEIELNGSVSIISGLGGSDLHLSESIREQYLLQHVSTTQDYAGAEFDVTLVPLANLQEVFQRHSIPSDLLVFVSNSDGEDEAEFYEPSDIDNCFRKLHIHLVAEDGKLSVEQLEALVYDLGEKLLFLLMKHN